MPWMVTLPTQPLASRDHWGLQRPGLLGGGLPDCLQPRRGSITEDFLFYPWLPTCCPRREGTAKHLQASSAYPPPRESPALQMSLVLGAPAPQGLGEGDGQETGSAFGVAGD